MSNRRRKRERDKKYRKHLKFLEYHIGGYTPSASGNRELEELDWELAYDKPNIGRIILKHITSGHIRERVSGIRFTENNPTFP